MEELTSGPIVAQVRIDRLAVLEFFDDKPATSLTHATALCAVAGEDLGAGLLKHYLENEEGADVTIFPTCTQGTKMGCRLDCWAHAVWNDHATYFQVEIKNWSAHAIGGRKLALDARPEMVATYKIERWAKRWDTQAQTLKDIAAQKVLVPMRPPTSDATVEPLVCFWDALHPNGDLAPFFSVALPEGNNFPRLWVFSMSAYLRNRTESHLILDMPAVPQRLYWLNRLFKARIP